MILLLVNYYCIIVKKTEMTVCTKKGCPNPAVYGFKQCEKCRATKKRSNSKHKDARLAGQHAYRANHPDRVKQTNHNHYAKRQKFKHVIDTHETRDGVAGKTCSICFAWKPLTDYAKAALLDGLKKECKHCFNTVNHPKHTV